MAQAMLEPVRKPNVRLILTADEAAALYELAGYVTGSQNSPRVHTNRIFDALEELELVDVHGAEEARVERGEIHFRDYE